jgi:Putative zinc-finger
MRNQEDTNICARAVELVAYIYGEASEPEASAFEGHLKACASCEAELKAFGQVRTRIGAWRREALGPLESPAIVGSAAPALASARASSARKPSALAALREFFALSPMWLRAATAFASLAICALVVFAAARLVEGPRVQVVEKIVEKGPSQAEVNALVDKKVQEELASRTRRDDAQQQQQVASVSAPRDAVIESSTAVRSSPISRRSSSVPRHALASVSAQESEQFARDLQLIPTREDENLPRLIDLMDEAN